MSQDINIRITGTDNSGQAFNSAKKNIDALSGKLKDIGSEITSIGVRMAKIGAVPTAGLVFATKAAIDFESAFAGVRKTIDASEEEYEVLEQKLRDMAKTMPIAQGELAKIMEIAGQLGVRGVEELTKFTDTIARISESTNLTTETAATSLARIANIMREPLINIDRMGSAVVDLGNNFATTEAEIVEFANRIAGSGKIAGLATKDIFSIGTAFSSVGVQVEAGGTAVQKVLMAMTQAASGSTSELIDNTSAIKKYSEKLSDLQSKLAIATQKQAEFTDKTKQSVKEANQARIDKYSAQIASLTEELNTLHATHGQASISASSFAKAMGMADDQFKKLFKDNPAEAFRQFVESLGNAGDEAISILNDLDLSDQRLLRAFLSLAQNSNILTDAINMGNKAWDDNLALLVESEKRFSTTESQLGILKNKITDIGITIGKEIKEKLDHLLSAINPVMAKFADFIKQNSGLVATVLMVGAAIGTVGVVLMAIGAIISAISSIMNPIGLTIMAIVVALTLLYEAWTNNWGGIQEKTMAVWAIIKPIFTFLGELFTALGGIITNEVLPFFQQLFDKIALFWLEIQPYLQTFFSWLFEKWSALWGALSVPLEIFMTYMNEVFWEHIIAGVQVAWELIKGVIMIAWESIAGAIKIALQIFSGDWQAAWNTAKETFVRVWEIIVTTIRSLWEKISTSFAQSFECMKEIGRRLVEGLWSGISAMTNWIGERINDFVNGITDKFKSLFGIASPSRVFAEMGKMNVLGLEKGMKVAIDSSDISGMARKITNSFDNVDGVNFGNQNSNSVANNLTTNNNKTYAIHIAVNGDSNSAVDTADNVAYQLQMAINSGRF